MVFLPLIHKPGNVSPVAERIVNIENIDIAERAGTENAPGLQAVRGIKEDGGRVAQRRINGIGVLEISERRVGMFGIAEEKDYGG